MSWQASNLATWYSSFVQRDNHYRSWLHNGRPHSCWLTGFFNPLGFLTAVQQEITRSKKNESWALDMMSLHTEVTDIQSHESIRSNPKVHCAYYLLTIGCLLSVDGEVAKN